MTQHRAIYKSTSVEFLDDFYRNEPDAVALAQGFLANPNDDVFTVAESFASATDFANTELQGFQTHWLDDDSALSAHDIDRVVRYSYRAALELANAPQHLDPPQPPKLVETFWVRGAGVDFEVHIHEGVDRITVFMLVPVVRRYGSHDAATRSFVVRVGDLDDVEREAPRPIVSDDGGDPVHMVQVSGPYPEPEED